MAVTRMDSDVSLNFGYFVIAEYQRDFVLREVGLAKISQSHVMIGVCHRRLQGPALRIRVQVPNLSIDCKSTTLPSRVLSTNRRHVAHTECMALA